jgi:hypothetical protein
LSASTAGVITMSAGAAGAAPLSDCTAHHGTIVAVEFAHWDGPIVRGCGIDQRSGYNLIHAAGFTTAGDEHDGPAFICRLGDSAFHHGTQYPTPGEDACVQTPPASAYWSYWLAPPGQNRWTYSPRGAMSDVPKPGEVELWTFGGTDITGAVGAGVPAVTPDRLRDLGSASANATTMIVAAEVTRLRTSSGSAAPLIVGICLAAAMFGGAGWTARRRRYG